jgi:hypothetical protein
LSLTNICTKTIKGATLHLVYRDESGVVLKEWTTRREFDHPLESKATAEISQPAYFMPLITRRLEVKVEGVRFTDGTEWLAHS